MNDLRFSVFEVKPGRQFFSGLVQGIVHLLVIYFGNNIKRWH